MLVYRLLLHLFPEPFRRRFGPDMAEVFADQRRAARRAGAWAVAQFWWRTLLDISRQAIAERRRPSGAPRRASASRALVADVQGAVRGWRHRPGPTAVALVTLTLGIGANTAIFSAVDAFFLRPLPYPHADALVSLYGTNRRYGFDHSVETGADVAYWRAQATTVTAVAAFSRGQATLTGAGAPEALQLAGVTADLFEMAQVSPLIGRPFTGAEARADEHVVLLSFDLWMDRFAGTPAVLGHTIHLDGLPWRILGVMPAGFALPAGVDLWTPFDLSRALANTWYLGAFARLKPDVTVRQAQREFDQLAASLAATSPRTRQDRGFQVIGLREDLASRVTDGLKLIEAVVAVVLVIACANVGHLLLALAIGRQHEFAVRTALGAGPGRLMRQVLTESVTLALLAATLASAVAVGGVHVLAAMAPPTILSRTAHLRIDGTVLAFTLTLSMLTAVAFGLAPALLARRAQLGGRLPHGRGTSAGTSWIRRDRLRGGLVVAETALAVILLAGGGLLVRSFVALRAQAPGIRIDHLLTARLSLPAATYPTPTARTQFVATLVDRLSHLPGTERAAAANAVPYAQWEWQTAFRVQGQERPAESAAIREVLGDNYFATLGIPVLAGRALGRADTAEAPPVMVVSDVFARRFLPATPIGARVSLDRGATWSTVVGIVAATRNVGLDEDWRAEMYVPLAQTPTPSPSMFVALQTTADPAALARPLRAAVASLDPNLPVESLHPMRELLDQTVAERRFFLTLLAGFASLATVLAALGVYGVMAFLVSQARQEIGIRLALGARPAQIQRRLVGGALSVVGTGVGVGLVGAWWLTRLLGSQLFHVSPHDPLTLAGVTTVLLASAVVATWMPARRAAGLDPVRVLRAN